MTTKSQDDASGSSGRMRPDPDPTLLTTAALLREIANLKEMVTVRLDGMDKAVSLLQDTANRSPTINEVFLQHEERLRAIALQFLERDTRTEQTSRDSKVAVDAALQAAKEAVNAQQVSNAESIKKSETGTTKQIDQIGDMIRSMTAAVNDKIDDIKDRITAMESRKTGSNESWGMIIGIGGMLAMIAAAAVALAAMFKH